MNDPLADLPSARDINTFLRYRHCRQVIVGSSQILVCDKTVATLHAVERLNHWEVRNQVSAVAAVGFNNDPLLVLQILGLGDPVEQPSKCPVLTHSKCPPGVSPGRAMTFACNTTGRP